MADEPTVVPDVEETPQSVVAEPETEVEAEVEELWEPSELDLSKIQSIIEGQPDAEEKELHLGIFKFNFRKLMKTLVNLRDSTLSTARAKEIFETSDDDEIVKVREEIAEKGAEIAELRAPIDAKIANLEEQYKKRLAEFRKELTDAVGSKEDDLEDLRNETLKSLAADQSSGVSPEDAIEESKSLIAKIRKMELSDDWTVTQKIKTKKGDLVEKKVPVYSFTKNDIPSFVDVVGKEAMEIYFDGVKSKSSGGKRKFAYLAWAQIDGGPKIEGATFTSIKGLLGLASEDTYKSVTRYLAEVCPDQDLGKLPIDSPTEFEVPGKLGKMHKIVVQGRSEK